MDAKIEEYNLAQFPELSGRFDEPRCLEIIDDWFREWELVEKMILMLSCIFSLCVIKKNAKRLKNIKLKVF